MNKPYNKPSDARLRAESARFFRKEKLRRTKKLVPAAGTAPEKKLPEQIFLVIEALDAGETAVPSLTFVKDKVSGKEIAVLAKNVRIGEKLFHRSHFLRARVFRKQRTALRIAQLIKAKRADNEDEARKYLEIKGWNPT